MYPRHISSIRITRILPVFLLALVLVHGTQVAAEVRTPRLSSNTDVATAGYFQLVWETDTENVELQESADPDFTNPGILYNGSDRATVISGKPDGTWYYRIRAVDAPDTSPWSDTVKVEVSHHTMNRALVFLSLGIAVFVALAFMVIKASRGHR